MPPSATLHMTFWFPTADSVARGQALAMETNLHRRPRAGAPSLAERVWSSGDMSSALSALPEDTSADVRSATLALLAPWPPGRYTQALKRSGGILNLFRPLWRGQREPVWERMRRLWYGADDARGGQPPLALQRAWNHTPLPALGGLTPAQAMVGVGPAETEVTWAFMEELERRYGEGGFAEEEGALRVSVELLGDWMADLEADGRPLREMVVAERSALLARRAELVSGECIGEAGG